MENFDITMTKWDVKEFLLKQNIEESEAEKIFSEDVDGRAFVDITNTDLKDIGLKLGTRKHLLRLINALTPFQNSQLVEDDLDANTSFQSIEEKSTCSSVNNLASSSVNNLASSSVNSLACLSTYEVNPYSSYEIINVREMVQSTIKGKKILSAIENKDSDAVISRKDVCEIVRICVGSMVRDLKSLYPTTQQKINLAKAIVHAIPVLKSEREGVEGYESFFDPLGRAGAIEFRLKTMRVSLSPSKKKNKRKLNKIDIFSEEETFDEEEVADKITFLQFQLPIEIHKTEIFQAMKATFFVRRAYIKKENPTISKVLAKYPKLKDFNGTLIDAEFKQMYPDAGSFLGQYPSFYAPRILHYVRKSRLDIWENNSEIPDENFRSLLMLAELLPVTGLIKKKNSTKVAKIVFTSDAVVRYLGVNADLDEAAKDGVETQPHLVCCGSKDAAENKYFLILDNSIVDCGLCGLKAFDMLYKSHYVFNVKYANNLTLFYNFMDHMVYKLKQGPARSMVENIHTLLSSVQNL